MLGMMPIHIAAEKGHVNCVDVSQLISSRETPARTNPATIVQRESAAHAAPVWLDHGCTLAWHSHVLVSDDHSHRHAPRLYSQFLINKRVDLDAGDNFKCTALHLASIENHVDIVRKMLAAR